MHTIGEGVQKCNKDVIKDGKVISEDEIIGASQLMYKHGKMVKDRLSY